VLTGRHAFERYRIVVIGASLAGLACTGRIGGAVGDRAPAMKPPPSSGEMADPPSVPPGTAEGAALGAASLRLLTVAQYRSAVEDLFGAQALAQVTLDLEPDARLNGLSAIGAGVSAVSPRATELYQQAGEAIAAVVLADGARAAQVGCDPQQAGCLEGFVGRVGRRAWRRPLSVEESARYVALARRAGDAWGGLRLALAALLQSPHFLYRVELGQVDPSAPGQRRLDPFEAASRLAFFLTNRAPDDALLDAAARGALGPSELRAQAMRLLGSPRAVAAVESFYGDYLGLDELADLTKAAPAFTPALRAAMREESLRTLRVLTFEEGRDLREVFTSRTTFVTPELARFYGVSAPAGTEPARIELPDAGPRAGLLTQAGLLALNAHETSTSPTRRGKFVRELLLCQSIPDPPPNVDTTLPATAPVNTTRGRVEAHQANPSCATCHALMDPIGLGFERFDAAGAYRDRENGNPIDASGALDGVAFDGARELAAAVARHPDVPGCFVTTLLRQAAGAVLESPDERALAASLAARFATRLDLRALLLAVVTQPAFLRLRAM
jgi:hypothetical protein